MKLDLRLQHSKLYQLYQGKIPTILLGLYGADKTKDGVYQINQENLNQLIALDKLELKNQQKVWGQPEEDSITAEEIMLSWIEDGIPPFLVQQMMRADEKGIPLVSPIDLMSH